MSCKVCKAQGHSKVSCPYIKAEDLANISQEDRAFWSCVHPEDRPSSLGGSALSDEGDVPGVPESDSSESEEESSTSESESDDVSSVVQTSS